MSHGASPRAHSKSEADEKKTKKTEEAPQIASFRLKWRQAHTRRDVQASERCETEEPQERARSKGAGGGAGEGGAREGGARRPPDAAAKLRVKNETMARLAMALRQVLNTALIQP